MNTIFKSIVAITFASFLITGCSSTPEPKEDNSPTAQQQKNNATAAQRELSSETRQK